MLENTSSQGPAADAASPSWETIKKVFDFGKKFGKNSILSVLLLWALDFRVVRQGAGVGHAFSRGTISWLRGITGEVIARAILGLFITIVFGVLTLRLGDTTMFGSFFITMFGVSLFALVTYLVGVGVIAAGVYDQSKNRFGKRQPVAPAEEGASGQKEEEKDSAVTIAWKIYLQVLYWEFIFLMTIVVAEPWQPGRLKLFLVLMFAEAALFVLTSMTRTVVRWCSMGFATVVGAVEFLLLVGLHLSGPDMATTTQAMINKANDRIVFASTNIYRKAIGTYDHSVTEWHILPAVQRCVDMDEDDQNDVKDLAEVGRVARDPQRLVVRTIDGIDVMLGDFNCDGKVDLVDSSLFASYLTNGTPLLPDMTRRKQLADQMRAPLDAENSQSVPRPGVQSKSMPIQAQFASVVTPTGQVSEQHEARTIAAGVTSSRAASFFDLILDSVTVEPSQTIAYVTWTNPRSGDENASLSSSTVLRDNLQNVYRLSSATGVDPGSKVKLTTGQRVSATLEFPPLKPGATFVTLEVQDLWQNGPFTLACSL